MVFLCSRVPRVKNVSHGHRKANTTLTNYVCTSAATPHPLGAVQYTPGHLRAGHDAMASVPVAGLCSATAVPLHVVGLTKSLTRCFATVASWPRFGGGHGRGTARRA